MDGKIILLIFLCINIMSFGFSASCAVNDQSCGYSENGLIQVFFDVDDEDYSGVTNTSSGIQRSEAFKNSTESLTQPQGTGISLEGISAIVDVLLMIASFLSLLTPIPLIALILSFNMPFLISLFILIPCTVLYIIAVAQFVRGASF
jgi:hypothetical protein